MKKQNTQGFTLVEILIALVLLSVVAVGFTRFQSSNLSDSVISNQRTQASTIAQQQLEQLRSLASSQGTANFIDNLDTESPDNQFIAQNTVYTRTWQIEELPANDVGVHITVAWPDHSGSVTEDTTLKLSSVISGLVAESATAISGPIALKPMIPVNPCNIDGHGHMNNNRHFHDGVECEGHRRCMN